MTFLVLAAVIGSSVSTSSATSLPAIAAFDQAFSRVDDYTVVAHAHEVNDRRTQDRVYRVWFKKPHLAKTQIVSGPGAGSSAVWSGGDTVRGHLGGILSFIHLTIGVHDARATSLRGFTIPEGLIQSQVHRYSEVKGILTERDGPPIGGQATSVVDLRMAPTPLDPGVTRVVMYFSKTTHFPVERVNYSADGKILSLETWSELRTNVGLTDSDF